MPADYRDYQTIVQGDFLQGRFGRAWGRSFGAVKQSLLSRMKQSVKAKMPLVGPPDAVLEIGIERGIIRGINESASSYAIRVVGAWEAWRYAGNAFGILTQLRGMGYDNVNLLQARTNVYTLDGSGNLVISVNPNGGFNPPPLGFWNHFSVIFDRPLPATWYDPTTPVLQHWGTGLPAVTYVSGGMNGDQRIVDWVTTTGGVGVAQHTATRNYGATAWPLPTTLNSGHLTYFLTNSLTVNFSAIGAYQQDDEYVLYPTPHVPANNSDEANRIKNVVRNFMPEFAVVDQYIIISAGGVSGWPFYFQAGGGPGYPGTGGMNGAPIYAGSTVATYWTA